MKLSFIWLGFSMFFIMFYSCSIGDRIFKEESLIYRSDFEVHHRLINESRDSAVLYVQADSDEFEISIIAYSAADRKLILAEEKRIVDGMSLSSARLPFRVRQDYYLSLVIRDLDTGRIFRDAFYVDKSKASSGILMKNDQEGVLVKPYTDLMSEWNISHHRAERLWVKYFDKEFRPAAPPFSDRGYKFNPKKNFREVVSIENGGAIQLEGEGLYFIQTDTAFYDGLFVNVRKSKYPRITSVSKMVESTRYITKLEEYQQVIGAKDMKDAIDEFWLGRAKDKEFAKNLIKTYYSRVQIANRDFTTYKEGWKTDRGMLSIIFGMPDEIHKKKEGEIWSYRAAAKRNSVRFEFKERHGQTLLVRMEYFKRPWDVEVYDWRKGILND